MNKKEFIEEMAVKTGKTKVESAEFVDAFLETVTETLSKGDSIAFVGFGNFEVRDRNARTSRNPRTGETIQVPATKLPAFKAGSKLRSAVKGK